MKKVTIAIVLLVCVMFKSNGQEGLSYGPMIGVSMTSFSDGFAPLVSDYAFGYNIGANVNYQIISLVGVNASVSYAKIGGNNMDADYLFYSGEDFTQDVNSVDVSMHTIDINVLANIYLPISLGPFQPKVLLGAGNAYFLSSKAYNEKYRGMGIETTSASRNIDDRITAYDFAAIGGVGIEMEMGDNLIIVDVKYRLGFTDVNNVAMKPSFNTTGFVLSVGYNF